MGVQGIFPVLRKKGFPDTPTSVAQFEQLDFNIVHYDIKACHFGDITRELATINHIDGQDNFDLKSAMSAVAESIHYKVQLWSGFVGKSARFILHIDGPDSAAKGPTHEKRLVKREVALKKLASDLGALSRKKDKWASRKLLESAVKHLRGACQLTPAAVGVLATALKELKYDVCTCRAETDPCIADLCRKKPKESAVLSIDSV